MQKKDDNARGKHEHPLRNEITDKQREQSAAAHHQADKDMEGDADLTSSSPNDDLDEEESARRDEKTEVVSQFDFNKKKDA